MNFHVGRVVKYFTIADLSLWAGWGFIDPVFSSGVHIALNSARIAYETIDSLGRGSRYSERDLAPFATTYQTLFWTYYRFVKMFYEKNLVENLFLLADKRQDDPHTLELTKQFTSILSGDVKTPNGLVNSLFSARIGINPEVARVFAHL